MMTFSCRKSLESNDFNTLAGQSMMNTRV